MFDDVSAFSVFFCVFMRFVFSAFFCVVLRCLRLRFSVFFRLFYAIVCVV